MPLPHALPIHHYIGPQLIGSFVNTVLYTLEVVTVLIYHRRINHKHEKVFIRLLVLLNLFVDTIGSFAVCAGVYTFCVIFWGNTDRAERTHWTLMLSTLMNSVVAFNVQGFLNYRYYKISSNRFVSVGILAFMLFTFSATLHLIIVSANPNRTAIDRVHDVRDVCIALAGAVGTDIAINTALCLTLFRIETFNRATRILIRRIITLAIATGVATSFFASVTLITYLIFPLSRISTCFSLFLGRVYSLTMLYTLIHRESLAKENTEVTVVTSSSSDMARTETRSTDRTRSSSVRFFYHPHGMVFSGHETTFSSDSDRSHPTSERSTDRLEDLSQRTSCRSDAPYHSKNTRF